MKIQTQIPLINQSENQIDYQSKLLVLGSCFAENIGYKLNFYKFQSLQNPFGILFHPKAIETLIQRAFSEKKYTEEDIFFHNEQWHCYDAHSKLSHPDKNAMLRNLNDQLLLASEGLSNATHIIITLGTAWIYKELKTNLPVANCHKIPQKAFAKELLSVEAVVISLRSIVDQIKKVNPKAVIIFTVSPVRHLKDGFIQNTQSKAHLIAAIHQFVNLQLEVGKPKSYYFPSYEIMLDELRDYRFYTDDMLHPSNIAIDYIWEKFMQVWMSDECQQNILAVATVQNALAHRPFNPQSEAHQIFLQQMDLKIQALQLQFPFMNFTK